MHFIHNKYKCNKYTQIAEPVECTNARENQLVILYTYKGSFLNTIRIKLIQLLMPSNVFVRDYLEFHEKFTKIN